MSPIAYEITGFATYRLMLDPVRVVNIKRHSIIAHRSMGGEMLYYTLFRDGRPHTMTLHTLAARAFVGEPPGDNYIGELIQSAQGIAPGNVRWVRLDQYRSRHNARRVMTPALILEARVLRKQGLSYPQIARRLGVSTQAVWVHLNPDRAKRDAAAPASDT